MSALPAPVASALGPSQPQVTAGRIEVLPFSDVNAGWLAIGPNGTLYATDHRGSLSADRIAYLPKNSSGSGYQGSVQGTVGFTDLVDPFTVTVDGAGAVYTWDGLGRVLRMPAGATAQQQISVVTTAPSGSGGGAVVAAGNGDLYLEGGGGVSVIRAGSSVQQVLPIDGGLLRGFIALDGSKNIYMAGWYGGILELRAGSTTPRLIPIPGISRVRMVAADKGGNVYVLAEVPVAPTTQGVSTAALPDSPPVELRVLKLAARTRAVTTLPFTPPSNVYYGFAVDDSGNVFMSSSGQVLEWVKG